MLPATEVSGLLQRRTRCSFIKQLRIETAFFAVSFFHTAEQTCTGERSCELYRANSKAPLNYSILQKSLCLATKSTSHYHSKHARMCLCSAMKSKYI